MLSPWLAELAMQHGSTCSFAIAARLLSQALRTSIRDDTVRRLTEAAGAIWCQLELDLQVPQAVRVLDVMHAVEYLAAAAKASFGAGTAETSEWLGCWRHALRVGRWREVLTALQGLPPSPEREDAGRHWRPESVNPMVGLCALIASGRWAATWPRIVAAWPRQHRRSLATPPPS